MEDGAVGVISAELEEAINPMTWRVYWVPGVRRKGRSRCWLVSEVGLRLRRKALEAGDYIQGRSHGRRKGGLGGGGLGRGATKEGCG